MEEHNTRDELKAAAAAMGRKGGTAKNAKLTKQERSEIGYQLAAARAAKKLREKEAKAQSLVDDAFKDMPNINGERPFEFTDEV